MRTKKISIFIVVCLLIITEILAYVEKNETSTRLRKSQYFEIIPGIKVSLGEDAIRISIRMRKLIQDNEVESRGNDKKPNILQRIGTFMMMIPLGMQLLSLPSAIASIKIQLIRSIVVAKMALMMIIFNAVKSSQMSEVVMVQPHHHDHYYETPPSAYHQVEDDDQGWIGNL